MKLITFISVFLFTFTSCSAQKQQGYSISVKLKGVNSEKVQLAYYYEDKQYIVQEKTSDSKGRVTFEGEKELLRGIYIIIIPSIQSYFDILIADNQNFSVKTERSDIHGKMKFTDSEENSNFYIYQHKVKLINEELIKIDSIEFHKDSILAVEKIEKLEAQIEALNATQISNHPNSFFSALLNAMDAPSDKNTDLWKKVNLKEAGLIRTPFFKNVIFTHIVRLNESHANKVIAENKKLLARTEKDSEMRNYIAFKLLNFYRTNQRHGMNRVFVQLADNYFLNGNSTAYDAKMMEIIKKQRDIFKASFIGETARNIKVQNMKGDSISLHDISADFTLVYFWSTGCGHCKKASTSIKEHYKSLKKHNVKVIGLNTNETSLVGIEKYLKEKPVPWQNCHDFTNSSRYKEYFYAVNAPQMFVLDKNKVIINQLNGADDIESFVKKLSKVK